MTNATLKNDASLTPRRGFLRCGQLTLLTAFLSLPALAYVHWTGAGGDLYWGNTNNWQSDESPAPSAANTQWLLKSYADGTVFTNNLPFGPYKRITVPQKNRSFTVRGEPMALSSQLDNTGGTEPVVHRYEIPIHAYGSPLYVKAEANTMQVFEKPFVVPATNVVAGAKLQFGSDNITGTNVINGGISMPVGCYTADGGDAVRFCGATTFIHADTDLPNLQITQGAHVIISNATVRTGWSTKAGYFHNCTVDVMKGGRFLGQSASVLWAQGNPSYVSRINVYDGGVVDPNGFFRYGDDGRVEVTVYDGGLHLWKPDQYWSWAGALTVTVNGGRLECARVGDSSHRCCIGYWRSKNAGIDEGEAITLNGGEFLCPGFRNIGGSSAPNDRPFYLNFNGGRLVAQFDTTQFNTTDSSSFLDRVQANVLAGGLVFDTRDHDVTWNGIVLRGSGAADGGLVKCGSGTLTVTAAGTYTGTNRVTAGTLVLGAANAATCLSVAAGAAARVTDAAYFAQAAELEAGAVLSFGGTTLALTSLASDSGVVTLALAAEDAGQRLAPATLDVPELLRFRLTDADGADWSANGTYTVLTQEGLAASVAARCRVDNPVAGKTYAFAVTDGTLKVTVADGSDAQTLVVTADTTMSDPVTVTDLLRIRVATGCTLTLAGGVTGNDGARIVVTGPGTLAITGGCSVPVVAEDAVVSITAATDLAGGLTLGAGAMLLAADDVTYDGAVTVSGAASVAAAEGKRLVLTGNVSGDGMLATAGTGCVSVADTSSIDGLLLGGVTAFATPPSGEILFAGGTLLYTGAADARMTGTFLIALAGSASGAVELAEGAGDLTVDGAISCDSSFQLRFLTAQDNAMTLTGDRWKLTAYGAYAQPGHVMTFSRGNIVLDAACRIALDGWNDAVIELGDADAAFAQARPVTVTVADGASLQAHGVEFKSSEDTASGADVTLRQTGGTIRSSANVMSRGTGDNLYRYALEGGTFTVGDGHWFSLRTGDFVFDVSGGAAILSQFAFGDRDCVNYGCHDVTGRPNGVKNLFSVTGGTVTVSDRFNWMGDKDSYRRRARVAVGGTGVLELPNTDRTVTSTVNPLCYSTVMCLDGGLLRLTGTGAYGTAADALRGLDDLTVGAGGAHIETAGTDVTLTQTLHAVASGGALVKSGAGTLTLAATNNFVLGDVDVREGTLVARLDAAPRKPWPDSLVALWTFDGDDPLADKSGNGYDLVQLHGETYPVAFTNGDATIGFAQQGRCAYWPACGGSLGMTNAVTFPWNAHTMSFWVKLKKFNPERGLVSFLSSRALRDSDGVGGGSWCICLNGSGSGTYLDPYGVYPGVTSADTVRLFTLDEWHMLTTVRDGTNVWEYIDAQPVTPKTAISLGSGRTDFKARTDTIISIGQTYGGFGQGNEYINTGAMMDEIAIFSRALSAEEVAALYRAKPQVPAPAVTVAAAATWNMNGGTLATPRLAGSGTVANGALSVTNTLACADDAQPVHVSTPVFPTADVTVDLGLTEDNPAPYGKRVVLTYDTLDAASAANVTHWKVTGTGRTRKFCRRFSVDTANKAVVLEISSSGLVMVLR